MKRGETGATNSAMRSVYLVPQQTRLHMSNPVSNLVQAAGDTPTSPFIWLEAWTSFASMFRKSSWQAPMRKTLAGPLETKLDLLAAGSRESNPGQ